MGLKQGIINWVTNRSIPHTDPDQPLTVFPDECAPLTEEQLRDLKRIVLEDGLGSVLPTFRADCAPSKAEQEY